MSQIKATRRRRPKGIFCLEGEWSHDLKRPSSVKPILELLASMDPYPPFIHRGIGTRPEFEYYLRKWAQRQYRDYPILYLAFHAREGTVVIGDQRRGTTNNLTLAQLATLLEGKCAHRLIHIGGCESVKGDERHLQRFLRKTGALAVSGYTKDVFWMQSTAFEVLFLETLQDLSLTIKGANAIENRLKDKAGGLTRALPFRIVVRKDPPMRTR